MIDFEQTDLSTIEAALVTSKGTMVVTFFPEQAPAHVRNFVELAQAGFYAGTAFHRVIRNYIVQGGCPNTKEVAGQAGGGQPGTGRPEGHPGVRAEFNELEHRRGIVSMARGRDPNSGASQFFIVQGESAPHLDGKYTVFGRVEEGLEVLDEIAAVECGFGPDGEQSQPLERIELEHIELRPRQEREIEGEPAEAEPRRANPAQAEASQADAAAAAVGEPTPETVDGAEPAAGDLDAGSDDPADDVTRTGEQAAAGE